MSELFDKQVNVQKEKIQGSCKLLQAHKKCMMKMKETKNKNNMHIKMLLMEGST